MTYLRRPFITKPGESLLIAESAMDVVERHAEFQQFTGLPPELIATSPLTKTPMPIRTGSAGPQGWPADLNPAAFFHPLFWLPNRVGLRYRFDDNGAADSIETEEEWMTRVALEVTLSELYSPEDGSWLDIMAFVDLDVNDQNDLARISAWLGGAEDELLDTIDLSDLTEDPENPHWALDAAATLLPDIRPAAWALIADDLARRTGEIAVATESLSEAIEQAQTIAHLALGVIPDVPAANATETEPVLFWRLIVERLAGWHGDLDGLLASEVASLEDSFFGIRDDYWPFVDALREAAAAQAAQE